MAASVRLALAGEFVPDAVNVGGGTVNEEVGAVAGPGRKLGVLAGALHTAADLAVGAGARRAGLGRR